ncbi:MAG: bacillithiol system redox-active protein YtxJ [Rhodothermales bacterium]|nr:bacillithiol system redox-active protein YtxJ [Rhodothermales bacterium]MBO6779722.1 bacillithiol system redox-active protein YtxJ [Rhodothermales bacterium]
MITNIDSDHSLDQAFRQSETQPVLLFKHSAYCGVSFFARREIEEVAEAGDVSVFEVVVQRARPVSNRIARDLGIRHESPQVILVRDHAAIWDASHGRVLAESIREALNPA